MLSFGFPPIASPSARALILGSLPGRLSLQRSEYYANPKNAFWKIVTTQIPDLPCEYSLRVAALIAQNIALWDVLAAATRSGSQTVLLSTDTSPRSVEDEPVLCWVQATPTAHATGFAVARETGPPSLKARQGNMPTSLGR
jgi:G:T/U-mismatch repair DNA glycosylase